MLSEGSTSRVIVLPAHINGRQASRLTAGDAREGALSAAMATRRSRTKVSTSHPRRGVSRECRGSARARTAQRGVRTGKRLDEDLQVHSCGS
jgi:hypothetical protein